MSERMTAVSAVLEDGGQVNIRQANTGDESALAAFYARLGVHDGHLWSPRGRSAAAGAAHEVAVLVPIGQSVTAWANDELIGVADYRTLGSTREAEVTVAVPGKWRGRGIETLLLEHLISNARQRGIESFHADVQADNSEMLPVLANLGLAGRPQEHPVRRPATRTVACWAVGAVGQVRSHLTCRCATTNASWRR